VNKRNTAKFSAVLRLADKVDSIGVPIFYSGNEMYVPEMDGDFRITRFLDFYNEDGFLISDDIPDLYRKRTFSIGDPAPLPFWILGKSWVIEGDAEKAHVEKIFGVSARTHPVLQDMSRLLDDARSGRINARAAEWRANDLASGFDDIFLDPPSKTRYWLSRYRVALESARKFTTPPHPIDVRLRNASSEWLKKFATKADLNMIGSLLGDSAQGIYSAKQIREVVFAFVTQRLPSLSSGDLTQLLQHETVRALFPDGIYFFYIENGWSHVPFSYHRPDFLEVMKNCIVEGAQKHRWSFAARMAALLFGFKDAPRFIDDVVMIYLDQEVYAYRKALDHAREENKFPREYFDRPEYLARLVSVMYYYDRIQELSAVTHGSERASGKLMDGRFSIFQEDVEEFRALLS
jgi:hypothetical protein